MTVLASWILTGVSAGKATVNVASVDRSVVPVSCAGIWRQERTGNARKSAANVTPDKRRTGTVAGALQRSVMRKGLRRAEALVHIEAPILSYVGEGEEGPALLERVNTVLIHWFQIQ
jgi:hypothetical protein